MIEIIYGLIFLNLLSITYAFFLWRKGRQTKPRAESIELQEFLMDLMSGDGLVHVKRVSPADILLRARRTK